MKIIEEIAAERERQVRAEGWSQEHDDAHKDEALAMAAITYAMPLWFREWLDKNDIKTWPWECSWWKPKSRRRDLIIAASLIVAEVERLDRRDFRDGGKDGST